jgi:hypothetical protein
MKGSATAWALLLSFATPVHASAFDALCGNENCRVTLSPAGISAREVLIENDRVLLWTAGGPLSPSQALSAANTIRGAAVGLLLAPTVLAPLALVWGGLAESNGGDVNPDLHFKILGCTATGSPQGLSVRFLSSSAARRFRMELPMFTNLVSGQIQHSSPCVAPVDKSTRADRL